MQTYNNLYSNLCSDENLFLAFKKARKGKSKKWYVKKFEEDLKSNLLKLKEELENKTYCPSSLKRFVIRDPKTRVIHASVFRDRVVHHALCNVIEPIFEKTFIFDSYANRKNKGLHKALQRFDKFKIKISGNGRLLKSAKDNNMVVGYALKADMKHYFDTVDHEILMRIIKRKITDRKVLWLIEKILSSSNLSGKGMPIGNLTSQIFANVYLNELDYFIKQKLRVKFYLRYVDDFILLDKSKETLFAFRRAIKDFLKFLRIELHEEKSQVYSLHKGISLLGFKNFYHYRLLLKKTDRKIEKRLEELESLCNQNKIQRNKISESCNSWIAHAKWANALKLRKKLFEHLEQLS